ncbi:MAG: hypothetical protein QNK57_04815 [Flavobacteriales bacterium]
MGIKVNHSNISKISSNSKLDNKKLFFFLISSVLFGTLSFVSYKPVSIKNDYSVDLVNHSKSQIESENKSLNTISKENLILESVSYSKSNTSVNIKISKNEFALIVGTYQEKYNAIILEQEMRKRGFMDCTIIVNNNLKKYWVALDTYKDKNQAELARERFLIDGWIKQI